MKDISRRDFLIKGSLSATALTVVPSTIFGKSLGHIAPSDKLNIAGIGIGGRGSTNLDKMKLENIVALCDVDWNYAKPIFEKYPLAKRYKDYRKMFDKLGKSIDAVMVATPDHTHAIIVADALTLGKHIYCEKPLTHTVYESRLLAKLAVKYNVATQMGNQGASESGVRDICNWIWNGEIGEVTKVEAFTNRPIWPQGLERPSVSDPIPSTLDWDLFIGPAKPRPFNRIYHPWNWRGWWDFGTGALGDMACHIIHPAFVSLNLGSPVKVHGCSTELMSDCAPTAQRVKYLFPARQNIVKTGMPEVEVFWYDGGFTSPRPKGMPDGKGFDEKGALIFHGTKDTLICSCYGGSPYLLSGRKPTVPKLCREIADGHHADWIRACKENSKTRIKTESDFSKAGPLNEMVVMGVLAVRLQGLDRELQWDGPRMRFKNIKDNDTIKIMTENGFTLTEGRPIFNKKYTEPINAIKFANSMIKHNYRDGWKIVDMPNS